MVLYLRQSTYYLLKKIIFLFCFCTLPLTAQNYIDLFKLNYARSFQNNFENTTSNTNIGTLEADLTAPIVVSKKNTLITGSVFNFTRIQLFPESDFENLYNLVFKMGIASQFSEKWRGTFVLLPKIASDFKKINNEDFFVGGFLVFKYQKNENLWYRFGAYGSQEAFGFFSTPIFGWYYISPNKTFEMDVSLPISVDINYTPNKVTYGLDYYGIGRGIALENNTYVDASALEFSTYIQYKLFNNATLLRAKLGYASNDFDVFKNNEKIDFGLSAFTFGDQRTQLNPNIGGGFFVRIEAIYRFNLAVKE